MMENENSLEFRRRSIEERIVDYLSAKVDINPTELIDKLLQ